MEWQYIVAFVGSLIVALAAVWFGQWLSGRANRKRAFGNLYAEVAGNIRASNQICEWASKDFEAITTEKIGLPPYPHLDNSVWDSVKGAVTLSDYSIAAKLDDAYLMISVINDLLRRVEEIRYRLSESFTLPLEQPQITAMKREFAQNITLTEGYIRHRLLITLEEVKTLLADKLNLRNSNPTN